MWPKVARAWTGNAHRQRSESFQFGSAATLFVFGAGDGNRTRTVSLGIRHGPAIRGPAADLT